MRTLQVLEALLLALLKDTTSQLYQQPISMFTREILARSPPPTILIRNKTHIFKGAAQRNSVDLLGSRRLSVNAAI